jgi:hypothetical protein
MRLWWTVGFTLALQACVVPRPPDGPPGPVVPTAPPARVQRTPIALDPRVPLFGLDEGFRNDQLMAESGANWQRVVMPWTAVQPNGADDFRPVRACWISSVCNRLDPAMSTGGGG